MPSLEKHCVNGGACEGWKLESEESSLPYQSYTDSHNTTSAIVGKSHSPKPANKFFRGGSFSFRVTDWLKLQSALHGTDAVCH